MSTEIVKNSVKKPIPFEKIKENIYRVCWGITEDSHYSSLFMADLTAIALESVIDNNEFTISELQDIIDLSGISEEEAISFLKIMITRLIVKHDSSDEVNGFFIAGIPVWLDKETRVGLALRFNSEKGLGLTKTTLWLNGMQFPFEIVVAEQILGAIEVYASMCYDNTQKHLAEIQKLTTVSDLVNYDFKAGYPNKLDLSM